METRNPISPEQRRVQVREGKKHPELHRRVVTFGELAADALEHSKKFNRTYANDAMRMHRLLAWWKERPADSLTAAEIEEKLASVESWSERAWKAKTKGHQGKTRKARIVLS